jgi:Tfp pilus assembly protein PilN
VAVAFLAIHLFQKAYVLKYKNQIAKQNIERQLVLEQNTELDQKIVEFENKLSNLDELDERSKMVKEILSNYTFPSSLLKELSFMMPPDVWVTQLSLTTPTEETKDKKPPQNKRLLTIEGIALDKEGVAEIVINLESHPWFKEVKLDFAEREENRYQKEVFNFLIEGKL